MAPLLVPRGPAPSLRWASCPRKTTSCWKTRSFERSQSSDYSSRLYWESLAFEPYNISAPSRRKGPRRMLGFSKTGCCFHVLAHTELEKLSRIGEWRTQSSELRQSPRALFRYEVHEAMGRGLARVEKEVLRAVSSVRALPFRRLDGG